MIQVNVNADLVSYPKLKVLELEELILHYTDNPLYVTFYARRENFDNLAFKDKEDSFLRVVLPYEEVLNDDDIIDLMLTHLAQNVEQLRWLDHTTLKAKIEALLRERRRSQPPQA